MYSLSVAWTWNLLIFCTTVQGNVNSIKASSPTSRLLLTSEVWVPVPGAAAAAALRLSTTWWCRLRFICDCTFLHFVVRFGIDRRIPRSLPVLLSARLPVRTLLLTWVATKPLTGSDCLRNALELVRTKVIFDDGRVHQWMVCRTDLSQKK